MELKNTQQSVAEKLDQAAGLNTVVSDLIKLTNALESYNNLSSHQRKTNDEGSRVLSFCIQSLVRLMAPLTPAFSEECWQVLQTMGLPNGKSELSCRHTSLFNGSKSWPSDLAIDEHDSMGSLQAFMVSIDGKPKFTSMLHLVQAPDYLGEEMEEWFIKNVFQSSEGQRWLTSERNRDLLAKRQTIFHKQLKGRRWIVNVLTSDTIPEQ
jgi:leucyl-tRNA synthetase